MDKGTRGELLDRLAGAIESVTTSHPLRVAVDGPPAAGKTTLADELALLLRARGREVIRASTESFHLPRAQRYRRGGFSPQSHPQQHFRLRPAPPGPARSAGPGRRPAVPARGLRLRHGHRSVPAGDDGPRGRGAAP